MVERRALVAPRGLPDSTDDAMSQESPSGSVARARRISAGTVQGGNDEASEGARPLFSVRLRTLERSRDEGIIAHAAQERIARLADLAVELTVLGLELIDPPHDLRVHPFRHQACWRNSGFSRRR